MPSAGSRISTSRFPAYRSDLLRNTDHDQKDERHNGDQPQGSRQSRDPKLTVAGTAQERRHPRALRDPSSARRDPGTTSVPRRPRSQLGAGMRAAQGGVGERCSAAPRYPTAAVSNDLVDTVVRVSAPPARRNVNEQSSVPVVGDKERASEEVVPANAVLGSPKAADTLARSGHNQRRRMCGIDRQGSRLNRNERSLRAVRAPVRGPYGRRRHGRDRCCGRQRNR